ncbi:efflux RND transporter periplasmic adaptor subunit [Nafulsella turpanensis]|uniref:efflux RND transporter periplasmic adaptor subunit n=1 Tax=Nafulsella turpanensis TaxID=1265690 RepID=UPI00034CD486|nr:efflux RND transporter periplasmic adaptor subunit [Nafulsella turpanensis]
MNKIDKKVIYIGLGFLVAGLFLGWIFFGGSPEAEVAVGEGEVAEAVHEHEEGEAEVWTCAMHPQIRQDGPGQCPICGMDLIPVASGGETVGLDEIQMTEAAMSIADIQTVEVERTVPVKEIYLPGKVQADERRIAAVTARFPGRIERLYVNFTGEEVRKGEKLASIYSPELIQAQKELLEAVSFKETNPSFYEAALNKLKLWDLTDAQIRNILEKGEIQYNFDIYATQSGTVVSKNVNEGDYVTEGQPLFDVANLNEVWVLFDAYESDLPWIEVGDEVKFTVPSKPGEVFTSEVTFIDPVINPQTRVAQVRTEVKNAEGELKPQMFAEGIMESKLDDVGSALVVPKTSVLWTGKRSVVYVKDPKFKQPTFEYREVILGPEAGDLYVVAEGLEAGEEIVANGVFKVDAAAQLQGKMSMMNPVPTGEEMPPMPGMDMGGGEVQVETEAFIEEVVPDLGADVPDVFIDQLNEVVEAYLVLKEGLVEADEEKVAKASTALLLVLEKLDGSVLEGEAAAFWQEKRKFLFQHAKLCKEADTLEGKRENFIYLSQPLIKLVEAFGADQTLYVDFCPMAQDGNGAYWLSEIEEIRNPFMPEVMLSCGEVIDVIEGK